MAKKTQFVCTECGVEHVKWAGKCKSCGEYGTVQEFKIADPKDKNAVISQTWTGQSVKKAVLLRDVEETTDAERLKSGLNEFDRAVGGGIMPAGVYLLSGDPGAGKSTILLQIAGHLSNNGKKVFYVSGEEVIEQLKQRAVRLGLEEKINNENFFCITDNNLENILNNIAEINPDLVIVDSIQTIYSDMINASFGSVSQVKGCAAALNTQSKQLKHALIIIGHITKDGDIAGPKVFEHMVDAVLKLENEGSNYRSITANKNRYGEEETGFFEMTADGMLSIDNPSNIFLPEDNEETSSAIFAMKKGKRSILVEVQSLIEQKTYNSPKRVATGIDNNRLQMLVALQNKYYVNLAEADVYVSILQGITCREPDADLPIFISIMTGALNSNISNKLVSFGEISLGGEIRKVNMAESRVRTAYKLGFNEVILPAHNRSTELDKFSEENPDLKLFYVKHIKEIEDVFKQIGKTFDM